VNGHNVTIPDSSTIPDPSKPPPIDQRTTAEFSRRRFLHGAALASAAVVVPNNAMANAQTASNGSSPQSNPPNPIVPNFQGQYGDSTSPAFQIPKRPMGSTGLQVSIIGMGGYHLGTAAGQEEVNNMVAKAMDHGVNFFDNAWEYHGGMSEERVGAALKGKRDQAIVMTKACTHGRKKDVAMKMLE
jgi:uncharacterized protein